MPSDNTICDVSNSAKKIKNLIVIWVFIGYTTGNYGFLYAIIPMTTIEEILDEIRFRGHMRKIYESLGIYVTTGSSKQVDILFFIHHK